MEIVDQEGQFVVHHSKLLEYGVMTSDRSSDVKEKLDALVMVEGTDYMLQDVLQHRKNGSTHTINSYMLTPESFKKCLMRAQRRPNQNVDPVIYSDYFLLLEKMVKLFSLYESTKKDAEIASRDKRIEFMFEEAKLREEAAEARHNALLDKLAAAAEDRDHILETLEERASGLSDQLTEANGQLVAISNKLGITEQELLF